jgi:hypothetical protein
VGGLPTNIDTTERRDLRHGVLARYYFIIGPINPMNPMNPPSPQDMENMAAALRILNDLSLIITLLLGLGQGDLADARRTATHARHRTSLRMILCRAARGTSGRDRPWPPGKAHAARHGPDQPGNPRPTPKRRD